MLRNKINTNLKVSEVDYSFYNTINPDIKKIYLILQQHLLSSSYDSDINSISIWYEFDQLGLIINYNGPTNGQTNGLFDTSTEQIGQIINQNQIELKILAYKNNSFDSNIKYIINNPFLIHNYKMSINSFRQPFSDISDMANQIVKSELKDNFFGLGGESGLICKRNMDLITDYHLITDNSNIHMDFLSNGFDQSKTELVNYKNLGNNYWSRTSISDYRLVNDNWLLFVNISKTGLKTMAKYIRFFSSIVYVGCDSKTIKADINGLSEYYLLRESIQIMENNFILIFDKK
jgi:hypothetical protein